MNRWFVAALLTFGLTIWLVGSIPESCDDAVFSCDGFMTAPINVVFVGFLVAWVFAFLGFIRSTK